MPFIHERMGDTVLYTVTDKLTTEDVKHFLSTSFDYYEQIGEAYGIIIDMRGYERLSITTIKAMQSNVTGMESNVPLALVANIPSMLKAIALTIDALTGKGVPHTGFCKTVPEAHEWLATWFTKTYGSRESMRGIKNSTLPPRPL